MRRIVPMTLALILLVLLPSLSPREFGRAAAATGAAGGDAPTAGAARRLARAPSIHIPLRVSLEYSTAGTTALLAWKVAVARAAQFLEDATNGQATIDLVSLTDDARGWAKADVRVYAHNTAVPNATIGGLSDAAIAAAGGRPGHSPLSADATLSSGGVFPRGSIHLGRTWSEYGPTRGRWSDPDGFRTIVHELGHYAFFLYDEYYAYDDAAAARLSAYCTAQRYFPISGPVATPTPLPDDPIAGSLMYWEYSTHKFWNGGPNAASQAACQQTRQWQVYHAPDWSVITSHYPTMTAPASFTSPPVSSTILSSCPACSIQANRWLLDLRGQKEMNADGYLAKWSGDRVLHEGVSYPDRTVAFHPIEPLPVAVFYPYGRMEIVGGDRGDLARITLTSPDRGTLQAVQPLDGLAGRATPAPFVPRWFRSDQPVVPLIAVKPLVAISPTGLLTDLEVTAANPLVGTPMVVGKDTIAATLFEAGRGQFDRPRRAVTALSYAGRVGAGGEVYRGLLPMPALPIVDGALYLTPREIRHEESNRVGKGAWALASISLSCNSPTLFAEGGAPGDEGGLDSGDGVVNVHLTVSDKVLRELCVGFTRQPLVPPGAVQALSAAYAIEGSLPLPAGGTVITLHYDTSLIGPGGTVGIVRRPLQGLQRGQKSAACTVPAVTDTSAGTVAAPIPPTVAADGVYQAVLASSPAVLEGLPHC